MRIFLFALLIVVTITSCGTRINDYYSRFVVNESGNPVDSVLVKENIAEKFAHKAFTDKNGYFRMNRTDNWLPDLILQKEGYQSDTIRMVWLQHGEKEMYSPLLTKDSSQVIIRKLNIE